MVLLSLLTNIFIALFSDTPFAHICRLWTEDHFGHLWHFGHQAMSDKTTVKFSSVDFKNVRDFPIEILNGAQLCKNGSPISHLTNGRISIASTVLNSHGGVVQKLPEMFDN